MFFLGIDPGVSGGLGIVDEFGQHVAAFRLKDATDRDVWEWFETNTSTAEIRGCMEKVSASPQMGVVSAFTFGNGNGFLRGLLVASAIPFDMVTPQRWQKELNCLSRGDKNVTKARAQQLWPGVKITHGVADCLLIAEYGRRQWTKTQPSPATEPEFALA